MIKTRGNALDFPARELERASFESVEEASGPLVPVKVGQLTRLLSLAEIRLIVACENYTAVTLATGDRLLVRRTMQQWADLLPSAQFVRVHRGLFVNLDQVIRIERTVSQSPKLHFGAGTPPLEVKRRHWPAMRTRLESWRAASPSPSRPPARSIAVLPFANLSRDPANELFCDGLTEELLNVLAHVPGLHVAARTSVFYFKGKNVPIPEIARQLGVAYVVEGSVRQSGWRVRITAQLIDASNGFHAWSDNFEQELTDIFAVQDKIAGMIAAKLEFELNTASRPARRVNPAAHRLAIEGRHFWNLRTADGFARAEASFNNALALDPNFAPAHAGLADVCNIRALYRLADGAAEVTDDLSRARAGAQRALQLNPAMAEPHATLGFVAFHEGRLAEGARECKRAFELNPNYATGYQFFAWLRCAQGRIEQALVEYDKAIALDPLSFINIDRYAAMLALAGRTSDALAANERAAALRPDVFVGNISQRAPLLLALGRRDEAIAAARLVRQIGREAPFRRNSDADAIHTLQQAGLTEEAGAYAAEILKSLPVENHLRGFVLAAVGRYAEAIPCLARTPTIMQPFLYWSDLWAPVRDKPLFQYLLNHLGRTREYQQAHARRHTKKTANN